MVVGLTGSLSVMSSAVPGSPRSSAVTVAASSMYTQGRDPGVPHHRQPAPAEPVHQSVAGRAGAVEQAVAPRGAAQPGCHHDLFLVRPHRGHVLLEPAAAGRPERVGFGQHLAAPVAVAIAEDHGLGEEPSGTELPGRRDGVPGALGPQGVGRRHVLVRHGRFLQRG
jgi:hypothetical protein